MYFCPSQLYYPCNNYQYFFMQLYQSELIFGSNQRRNIQNINNFIQQNITEKGKCQHGKPQSNLNSSNIQNKKSFLQEDSDYQPNSHNNSVLYKKKNTQSNISNQIYSFVSSGNSFDIVMKFVDYDNGKADEFYKLVKKIKKGNKKYMNRGYIINLIKLKQNSTNFKIYKQSKCSIQIQILRKLLRILVHYFIKNICDCSLLTSKKMNKVILNEHLVRKRQIQDYLIKQLKSQD